MTIDHQPRDITGRFGAYANTPAAVSLSAWQPARGTRIWQEEPGERVGTTRFDVSHIPFNDEITDEFRNARGFFDKRSKTWQVRDEFVGEMRRTINRQFPGQRLFVSEATGTIDTGDELLRPLLELDQREGVWADADGDLWVVLRREEVARESRGFPFTSTLLRARPARPAELDLALSRLEQGEFAWTDPYVDPEDVPGDEEAVEAAVATIEEFRARVTAAGAMRDAA